MIRPIRAALLALAIAAVVTGPEAQAQKPEAKATEQEACARACAACVLECEACYQHCVALVAGGERAHSATMRLCRDCSDICALTARIVARRGPTWQLMCDTCIKTCDACGKRC